MIMQKDLEQIIKNKVEKLLSKEYCCSLDELNGKETIYSVNIHVKRPYIKILAYKNCIVVCTSKNLHLKVQDLLKNKNRDEIFECPLAYGQTIHYVPDRNCIDKIPAPLDFKFASLFEKDILLLRGLTGFENSLAFNDDGSTSTKAVYVAKDNKKIVGIAGAAASLTDDMWEIGVDVAEEYRGAGLGTYLVSSLTRELLLRNGIPFYSASVTNVGSQMVAARCGYKPLWVDTFGTILDGSYAYDDTIKDLLSEFVKGCFSN